MTALHRRGSENRYRAARVSERFLSMLTDLRRQATSPKTFSVPWLIPLTGNMIRIPH